VLIGKLVAAKVIEEKVRQRINLRSFTGYSTTLGLAAN